MYAVSGEPRSPAVLFLHGFMGSSEDWREVVAALDGSYRPIAVDLPGHGASLGLSQEAYTPEGAVRALLGVLDEQDVERPVIAGYSMGGRLALYLALRYPGRCAGLFIESASPGIEDALERAARRRADENVAARLQSGDLEGFVREWYRQPLFASLARDEDLLRRTIRRRLRNDPEELAESLRGIGTGNGPSLWGELAGLEVPALAAAGELDEKYAGICRRMALLSPRMRTAVLPGVGHNAHAESSAAYLALLKGFLSTTVYNPIYD
jgi:2-succinyl-6-hydroxy-2,4-cyclohexadiene-1-carboxylate synthase